MSVLAATFEYEMLNPWSSWVEGWSPQRYVHILTLESVNVNLFGKRVFADEIKFRISR